MAQKEVHNDWVEMSKGGSKLRRKGKAGENRAKAHTRNEVFLGLGQG